MAKNYGVKDYLGDILRGMGGVTSLDEARAAGMPEAAGTSPEIFKALMGQQRMEPAMALREKEMGIKEKGMDIRESALGLQEERNKLARERLIADIDYRNRMLEFRKNSFSLSLRAAAGADRGFSSLSQAAIKTLGIQEKTPKDIQLLNTWISEMNQRGIDTSSIDFQQDDPGFWGSIFSGIKGLFDAKEKKPAQPAAMPGAPKPTPKSKSEHYDPAGLDI